MDEDRNVLIYSIAYVSKQYLMRCFIFFGYYHLYSEVGANSRRVVRHIPDEVLNNAELQDAVRQVKNVRICCLKNVLNQVEICMVFCHIHFHTVQPKTVGNK